LTDKADVASPPAGSGNADKTQIQTSAGADQGLSWAQKMFFVVAIVAVCALFLRGRGGGGGSGFDRFGKEKSMA
jgi:peptidyl-prolyl cis-trans isomerase B (cyclophilin B)